MRERVATERRLSEIDERKAAYAAWEKDADANFLKKQARDKAQLQTGAERQAALAGASHGIAEVNPDLRERVATEHRLSEIDEREPAIKAHLDSLKESVEAGAPVKAHAKVQRTELEKELSDIRQERGTLKEKLAAVKKRLGDKGE